MSEQKAEQSDGESGSVGAEPAVANSSPAEPVAAAVQESTPEQASAAPPDVPELTVSAEPGADVFDAAIIGAETLKAEALKPDAIKVDTSEADTSNADTSKAETSEADAEKAVASDKADNKADNVVTISPGDRPWYDKVASTEGETEQSRVKPARRRFATMAAVAAIALITGAIGGALAMNRLRNLTGDTAASDVRALQASVARIESDIAALKTSSEHNAKTGISQFTKTSERLDRLEKAQAEPAAKLAKITEAMERLRSAPSPAPAAAVQPAASKDVTGSISTAAAAPPPAATPPKTEVARLPTVDGWVLRSVSHGGALIEGRQGIYEVYAGDPVPGLGRVDAIRRQDGRWVVVTSKGLIVAR